MQLGRDWSNANPAGHWKKLEVVVNDSAQDRVNEASGSVKETAGIPERELFASLAALIRTDSRNKGRLTSREEVLPSVSEAERLPYLLNSLMADKEYADIKNIVAIDNSIYLYSDKFLSRKDAERLVFDEEVRSQIARKVREDSKHHIKLTPVNSLGMFIPGAEEDKVDKHLMYIQDDQRYRDICLVTNSKGTRYCYSNQFMTATYAGVLARADANDALATIAATVREESRIYPRPTCVSIFKAPVFKINVADLDRYVSEIIKMPEYQDIKAIRASTGVLYLYSESYLNHDWVKATVEWEEVGKFQNP